MSGHGLLVIMAMFVIIAIITEPMMALNSKILWYFFAFFLDWPKCISYMENELRYMISAGSYAQERNKVHQNHLYFDILVGFGFGRPKIVLNFQGIYFFSTPFVIEALTSARWTSLAWYFWWKL